MNSIAFYIGDYTRSGGTERSCISVANGIVKHYDLQVFLITTNSKNDQSFFDINPAVNIIYLDITNPKKQYFHLINKLSKEIKRNKIERIVAVEVMSLLFVLPLFLFKWFFNTKAKLWVWEHFNYTVNLGKKARNIMRELSAKYADKIIVLTERDVELWTEKLKINGEIVPINNPSPYEISQKEYAINSKNIVAIGRLTYQKGFDQLINIWSNFLKKYPYYNDWKLQIIGSGSDEVMLKNLVQNLELKDTIEFVPNTPNVKSYYENAAFLAMTSRFEGLPMTLIEAQSFGLPIIAYDCLTGPAEVITKETGFLIEDKNTNDFVEKLDILIQNSILRSKMSEAAKKDVERFSNFRIAKKWITLIGK